MNQIPTTTQTPDSLRTLEKAIVRAAAAASSIFLTGSQAGPPTAGDLQETTGTPVQASSRFFEIFPASNKADAFEYLRTVFGFVWREKLGRHSVQNDHIVFYHEILRFFYKSSLALFSLMVVSIVIFSTESC
jgi:hypothetical protein